MYEAYEDALKKTFKIVKDIDPNFSAGFKSTSVIRVRRLVQRFMPSRIKKVLRRIVKL